MEERNDKKSFNYTYSAKQQQEIKSIRNKYAAREEDKMEQLRRLDNGVTRKSMAVSLTVGIIGALVMGMGMSCVLVWQEMMLIPGIIIGLVGIVLVCLAYPLYNFIAKRERKKIAPEIIRLTDELLK